MDMFNETSSPIPYIDKYVAGVMISVAPYPYACPQMPVEIKGINPQNLKHLWQMDLYKTGDDYYSGRISGVVGFATSRGAPNSVSPGPEEATRRAYRLIHNLSIDNIQYRTDIGKGINDKLFNLTKLGVLPRI